MAASKKATVRKLLDAVRAAGRDSLTAPEGKAVCDAYAIPVPQEGLARTAAEAAKLATKIGYPVVLKIVSPQILHKTEAGGVLVGVKNAADVRKGFAAIMASANLSRAPPFAAPTAQMPSERAANTPVSHHMRQVCA